MSLLPFHRLLIAIAIVFCAGFAIWELRAYLNGGQLLDLAVAIAFGVAAVALGYYLRNLKRFLGMTQPRDAAGRE